ncbi:hypothetical protein AAJ76_220007110 [Vairimorpha ceranae]|uniref:Uncharacterized protein n=1 Tax=Vairimorpha ceranae TaxID=40302 RepID=A0A0F9WF78_9MICR|nr:hypothetical protein AAJ76_220007110 [Vairimorpha ceranae]KAF5140604.1 hypothetical protein G9O61_00g014090 [Vairimorpha ceranae]KKO75390.1 hypothetical protein AAJ76_220007110 [Vairimorpha ceranae]
MITFNDSPIIIKKLEFLSKYSSLVTITPNSLTTKKIQIIFSDTISLINNVTSLTFKTKDLLQLLTKSKEGNLIDKYFIIKYHTSEIEIEKKIKIFDEIIQIPCSEPDLSIKVKEIKVLCEDDCIVQCSKDGLFKISSNNLIETCTIYNNCTVISHKIDHLSFKIKSKELKILESFKSDKIFCFFRDYILVYILEDRITNIVMVSVLQN